MIRLTSNFRLSEFEKSSTATDLGISNDVPEGTYNSVYRMAEWLQILRKRLSDHAGRDVKVFIQSGYRSKALNEAVRGSKTSAHCHGLAADINAEGFSPRELTMFICNDMADIGFDQVILEFDSWVHVGLSRNRKRHQKLEATKRGGRTHYGELC